MTQLPAGAATARATMNGKPVFSVPSKSVINFDSGFKHKHLCDGPTFSAGTACAFSCSFCYVPDMFRKQKPWLETHGVSGQHEGVVIRRSNAVGIVRQQLTDASGSPKFKDMFDNRAIYASPAVDVAGNMELARETVDICREILSLTNWHIRLLSKSNLLPKVAQLLEETALELKPRERIIYGVSTGTLNDKLAQAFEEGAPLVSKRIQSLHWLQDNGFRTYGMICPSLPQDDYQKFAGEMYDAIRAPLCEHVWGEVLNARGENFTRTHRALLDGGFTHEAELLASVQDKNKWEEYARKTFSAHAGLYLPGKLRFLQYVTKESTTWWKSHEDKGAVLL